MDANLAIGLVSCGAAVVTCAICTGLILWKGGGQAERVESSVKRIEGIESKLEVVARIPLIEQRQTQVEHIQAEHSSKIHTMWLKLFSLDKHLAVTRASQHDISEE